MIIRPFHFILVLQSKLWICPRPCYLSLFAGTMSWWLFLVIHPTPPSAPQLSGVTALSFGTAQCQQHCQFLLHLKLMMWLFLFFCPKECLWENRDLQGKQHIFLACWSGGCRTSGAGQGIMRHVGSWDSSAQTGNAAEVMHSSEPMKGTLPLLVLWGVFALWNCIFLPGE